jgi:DnaK suppressor protein
MPDPDGQARFDALLLVLTERRRDAEARRHEALARQLSGDAAGDNEGVHGWKASREGGADVALLEALDQTLQEIDHAIARLHVGRYGLCASCSGPIPTARLKAVPFATRCVPCQEGHEGRPAGPSRGR